MFKKAEDAEIGKYIEELITQKFGTARKFGKSYLEDQGREVNDEELRKICNRLSPIIHGKKSIQIYDLDSFTKLLGVSCETLLSAGKYVSPENWMTVRKCALSPDQSVWDQYLNRADNLIFNSDEYGKTLLHYALEFGNYPLIQYLTENQYIWFDGDTDKFFSAPFGAETRIRLDSVFNLDTHAWGSPPEEKKELRGKIIRMAVEHRDLEMLTRMKAREIPTLYQASSFSSASTASLDYRDEEFIHTAADADDEVLEYFSQEFEITDRCKWTNPFLFPFMGELIELLIQKNHPYAEWLLKSAIQHNQYAYDTITGLLKTAVMGRVEFLDSGNLVRCSDLNASTRKDGIFTNLIRVHAVSEQALISRLIQELNGLYDQIQHIAPKSGREGVPE